MNEIIEEKLKLLPSAPGVYRMYNAEGEVIYVGKAISLKNRVRQYFQSSKNHSAKVIAMVQHIADFETVQVRSEAEALSLESNLIKQYRPKYNVLLKDDKHFPYIRIDLKQDYPRIEIVRRLKKDGARYLGPYLSASALRESMNVVRDYYPVRHCKKDLSKAIARRERPCLMYHVGKCCAPCSGKVSRTYYHEMLQEVMSFLNGDTKPVLAKLRDQMQQASDGLNFEKAAYLRDRIRAIESLEMNQVVIGTGHAESDVFAMGRLNGAVLVFALYVRDGKVIGTEKFAMDASDEQDADIMEAFLKQYYGEDIPVPREILVHTLPEDPEALASWLSEQAGRKVRLHRPERGDKRKLTDLCYSNCMDALEKDAELQKRAWDRGEGALAQLSSVLGLDSVPRRLECFDNSHMQGRDTVASMVVFTEGEPDKKAYRRFKIQAEAGGDDLVAMREVLSRRFERARDCDPGFSELPDLLIVDGGATQLNVALEVLSEFGLSYIPAIGLAESHEVIYVPGEEEPVVLPRNSAPLHVLERIRDEAHRFAITYHRSLRQKRALFSVLDEIPGIGEKRKRALFDAFNTLDAIRSADIDTLAAVPDMTRSSAEAVYQFFH